MRRTEAVLRTAQQAVLVEAFSLEVQNGVDHVLEDLRAGDRTVLGDVAHEKEWCSSRLRQLQEPESALAQLRHAARQRLHVLGHNRLDRVDHRQNGLLLTDGLDNRVDVGFCEEQQVLASQTHAPGAYADLRR